MTSDRAAGYPPAAAREANGGVLDFSTVIDATSLSDIVACGDSLTRRPDDAPHEAVRCPKRHTVTCLRIDRANDRQ